MLFLFLNPAVLCILVWLVARGTAEIDFPRMFLIAFGVGIVGGIASAALGEGYQGLLALIPFLGLLVFLLMKYCYISLQQSLIVAGLYFAYQVGLTVLFIVAFAR